MFPLQSEGCDEYAPIRLEPTLGPNLALLGLDRSLRLTLGKCIQMASASAGWAESSLPPTNGVNRRRNATKS